MTCHLRIPAAGITLIALLGLTACASVSTTAHPSGAGTAPSGTVVYTFGVAGTRGPVAQTLHEKPTPIRGIAGSVIQIATSNSDTYALTSAGTVWAWGVGSYGELGNGSTPAYVRTAAKVDFPKGVKITSLPNPMPFDGGLAIDSRGVAWGWGLNASHDLCLPGGLLIARPAKIPLPHVTLAAGARTHSLFDSDGTVYACGDGAYGELGNGSTASRPAPTAVLRLPEGKVKALTSSWGGSGALMADGSYYDWGYNQAGQLGDGSTTDSAVPVHVPLPGPVDQVFQGGSGPNERPDNRRPRRRLAVDVGKRHARSARQRRHPQLGHPDPHRPSPRSKTRQGSLRRVRLLRHRPDRKTLGLGPQHRRPARDRQQRAGPAHPRLHRDLAHADLRHSAERRGAPPVSTPPAPPAEPPRPLRRRQPLAAWRGRLAKDIRRVCGGRSAMFLFAA